MFKKLSIVIPVYNEEKTLRKLIEVVEESSSQMEKEIILIDDGIATGASIHSAIIALKKLSAQKIIIAVPVAPESTISELEPLVDEIICLYPAPIFSGVGQFYKNFSQTTDEEVINLLSETKKK